MPLDAMSEISDEALLALYARGDRAAAQALTIRLTPRVLGQASRLLGDVAEAEDVAQEAMLRLWRIAHEWRPDEARVTTWLYRVVANLCTDRLRKRRNVGIDDVAEPPDNGPGPEARLQNASRAEALRDALATLPERQRQAVALRHLEGLSNPEIAEIMDTSLEAVESLTARGKRSLAKALLGQRAALGYDDETGM